jgi:hypothetical protein
MKNLFNDLNSATINERKEATRLIIINDSYDEENFTSENEQNNDTNKAFYIIADFFN